MPEAELPEPTSRGREEEGKDGCPQPGLRAEPSGQCLAGDRHREGHGNQEGQAAAQPTGIDSHRIPARRVHPLEEVGHFIHPHHPEGGGGQDEPEAVDHHPTHQEQPDKGQRLAGAEPALQPRKGNRQHNQPADHVDRLPDRYRPNADQQLRILRLGQDKIQGAALNVLHQLFHIGLDDGADQPAHHRIDAHHRQQFR